MSARSCWRFPERAVAPHDDERFGLPTVKDILRELEKPGRDPRPEFKTAAFKEGVEDLKDLRPDMVLEGVVTNVTNFGAFVDIGVHQDGLVHVSELSDKFVSDPKLVAAPGQVVKVRVLSVDMEQKRISLSMKKEAAPKKQAEGKRDSRGHKPAGKPKKPLATMDQLVNKFNSEGKKKQNDVKLQFSLKSLMRSGR